MDGFRERLGARYDRSMARGAGYDRSGDDRYDGDRYERSPRRGAPEGISQEAISEVINEAISKSNREQLDIIADFFDEAKADRMESERAIIDALSHSMNESSSEGVKQAAPAPVTPIAVVDEENAQTLARIERIAGQNAEALNESNEMLERNVDSLRSNAEVLAEIKNAVGGLVASSEEVKNSSSELRDSVRQSLQEMSTRQASPMQELTVDFTSEKEEIIGAVGDNRAILNMIRQDVLNGFAKTAQDDEEEKVTPLAADEAEKYYKELEEHVHKECVKCYRNVQSALTEQNTEANSGITKSVSGLRVMVLVSLLLNIVTVALTVCNILGLFSF